MSSMMVTISVYIALVLIAVTTTTHHTPSPAVIPLAHAAKTYSRVCTTFSASAIGSAIEATTMCAADSATPLSPQSDAENEAGYDVSGTSFVSLLGGIFLYDTTSNLYVWIWYAPSVNQGEIFWVQPSNPAAGGGYAPTGAYASWWAGIVDRTTNADMNITYLFLQSEWFIPDYVSAPCVICQKEACSSACSPTGTDFSTGTWWPSCTCTCKPGWVGLGCNRQIAVYPISSVTSAGDLETFCAGKGGYLAQPTSLAEEDAILRIVPVNAGTDFGKPVAIGATANDTTRTYCYHDGRLDGECVTKDGSTVAGMYSDYGDGVPTTPTATTISVLRSFSYLTGRWSALAPADITQVACQFIVCNQFCEDVGTVSYSGDYPSCECICKDNYMGVRCQIEIIPTPTATGSDPHTLSLPSSASKSDTRATATYSGNTVSAHSPTDSVTGIPSPTSTISLAPTQSTSQSLTSNNDSHTQSATQSVHHSTLTMTATLPSSASVSHNSPTMTLTQEVPPLPTATPTSTTSKQKSAATTTPSKTIAGNTQSGSATLHHNSKTISTTVHPTSSTTFGTPTDPHSPTSTPSRSPLQQTPTPTAIVPPSATPTFSKAEVTTTVYQNGEASSSVQCPSVGITIYKRQFNDTSSSTLTVATSAIIESDIRNGLIVVVMNITNNASSLSTTLFTFNPTSMGNLSVWGSFGVEVASPTCTLLSNVSMMCSLPAIPNYSASTYGNISIHGGGENQTTTDANNVTTTTPAPSIVSPPCSCADDNGGVSGGDGSGVGAGSGGPWVMGDIVVSSGDDDDGETQPTSNDASATTVNTVRSSVLMAFGWFLLFDGTPIELQVLVVMLNSECGTDADGETVRYVRYFISPFMDFDWVWVVVGNIVVTVLFTLIHYTVVLFVRTCQTKSEDPEYLLAEEQRVSGNLLFPGLPLLICHFMYIGVACGTFELLNVSWGAETGACVAGFVYLVAVPVMDIVLMYRVLNVVFLPYNMTLLGCEPRNCVRSWFYPRGLWGPTVDSRRFVGFITPYRGGYRYLILLIPFLACVAALLFHAFNGVFPCSYRYLVIAIILLLLAVVKTILLPRRARIVSILTFILLVAVAGFAMLSFLMDVLDWTDSMDGVFLAKMALIGTAVVSALLRTIITIVTFIAEYYWLRRGCERCSADNDTSVTNAYIVDEYCLQMLMYRATQDDKNKNKNKSNIGDKDGSDDGEELRDVVGTKGSGEYSMSRSGGGWGGGGRRPMSSPFSPPSALSHSQCGGRSNHKGSSPRVPPTRPLSNSLLFTSVRDDDLFVSTRGGYNNYHNSSGGGGEQDRYHNEGGDDDQNYNTRRVMPTHDLFGNAAVLGLMSNTNNHHGGGRPGRMVVGNDDSYSDSYNRGPQALISTHHNNNNQNNYSNAVPSSRSQQQQQQQRHHHASQQQDGNESSQFCQQQTGGVDSRGLFFSSVRDDDLVDGSSGSSQWPRQHHQQYPPPRAASYSTNLATSESSIRSPRGASAHNQPPRSEWSFNTSRDPTPRARAAVSSFSTNNNNNHNYTTTNTAEESDMSANSHQQQSSSSFATSFNNNNNNNRGGGIVVGGGDDSYDDTYDHVPRALVSFTNNLTGPAPPNTNNNIQRSEWSFKGVPSPGNSINNMSTSSASGRPPPAKRPTTGSPDSSAQHHHQQGIETHYNDDVRFSPQHQQHQYRDHEQQHHNQYNQQQGQYYQSPPQRGVQTQRLVAVVPSPPPPERSRRHNAIIVGDRNDTAADDHRDSMSSNTDTPPPHQDVPFGVFPKSQTANSVPHQANTGVTSRVRHNAVAVGNSDHSGGDDDENETSQFCQSEAVPSRPPPPPVSVPKKKSHVDFWGDLGM